MLLIEGFFNNDDDADDGQWFSPSRCCCCCAVLVLFRFCARGLFSLWDTWRRYLRNFPPCGVSAAAPVSTGEGDDDEGDRMEDRSEPGGSDSALRKGFFLPLAALVLPSPPRDPGAGDGAGDLEGVSSLSVFLQLCILLHLFPVLFSDGSLRPPSVCQVYVFNKFPLSVRSPPFSSSCVTSSFSTSACASASDSLSVPIDVVKE